MSGEVASLLDLGEDEPIRLTVPRELRRGHGGGDERKTVASAIETLRAIAAATERPDWSRLKILDYGCGVKFTQALVQRDVPVGAYVGMDVFGRMIAFLRKNVERGGFHYFRVPFRNARYNPEGVALRADAVLPGPFEAYDLITLQSVLTHFDPPDFRALLRVLRRYAAIDARILFTCFIDDELDVDYRDLVPEKPLLKAYYREPYVRAMVEEAGWRILALRPPSDGMQHQVVCAPS